MRIMYVKTTIRTWSDTFKDLFLKAGTDFEFPISLSSLLHLITVAEKKRVSEVFLFHIK